MTRLDRAATWIRLDIGLILTEEEGEYWAHLFPKQSLQVTVPRYGRGASPEAAAQRARERYQEEQERV